MNWTKLGKNTFVAAVGYCNVIQYRLSEHEIVLIDSGSNESDRLFDYLNEQGLRTAAVLSTHLHIDHIANHKRLSLEHRSRLFAADEDIKGADNCCEVPVEPLDLTVPFTIQGHSFELIKTFGHSPGSISIVTPDNVCCIGDAMLSLDELMPAKLPYMYDAEEGVKSMMKLKNTDYDMYVPSHRELIPRSELIKVADANIEKEKQIFKDMLFFVNKPMDIDECADAYLKHLNINLANRGQPWLNIFRSEVKTRFKNLCDMDHLVMRGNIIAPN